LVPLSISFWIGSTYEVKGDSAEVVVVQPNVDPYREKFEGGAVYIPYQEQLARLIKLSEDQLTPNTKFLIWPETSISNGINWEESFAMSPIKLMLDDFLRRHPGLELVSGITTAISYPDSTQKSVSARHHP